MAETVEQAVDAAKEIQKLSGSQFCVVKAQIHAGGRGKGGGVKLAKSLDDAREKATNILGMNLITPQTGAQGKLVRKVLDTGRCVLSGSFRNKGILPEYAAEPPGRKSHDHVFNRRRHGY